jgi:hypothetical protein
VRLYAFWPILVMEAMDSEPDGWSQAWEGLVAFVRQAVESTALRWPGRVAEIAAIAICLFALTGIALWNGASLLWTLLILAAGLLVIRAPWRRVHR